MEKYFTYHTSPVLDIFAYTERIVFLWTTYLLNIWSQIIIFINSWRSLFLVSNLSLEAIATFWKETPSKKWLCNLKVVYSNSKIMTLYCMYLI